MAELYLNFESRENSERFGVPMRLAKSVILQKDLIFIVSGGRTGTRFMGDLLSEMIPEAYSVHEPDVLAGRSLRTIQRIREFGVYHMILGRVLRKTGIRNMSEDLISGRKSLSQVADLVGRQRKSFYSKIPHSLIVESYYQWYGILPVIPNICPRYRILGVLRDPRDWVRSYLNFETHYGKADWITRFGLNRVNPWMTGENKMAKRWETMTSFEKLCWSWKMVYQTIWEYADANERMLLIKFEDLFQGNQKESNWRLVLAFITQFQGKCYEFYWHPNLLERKIHSSKPDRWPCWEDWSSKDQAYLLDVCGDVMEKIGYLDAI